MKERIESDRAGWICGGIALLANFLSFGSILLAQAQPLPAVAEQTGGNALQPQGRAKVSWVRADMRSLATAIESYFVDNNTYPAFTTDPLKGANSAMVAANPKANWKLPAFMRCEKQGNAVTGTPHTVTTPISYITGYFPDPFATPAGRTYAYFETKAKPLAAGDGPPSGLTEGWIVWSPGPDGKFDLDWMKYNPALKDPWLPILDSVYDPTNGSASKGDIIRVKQ